MDSEDADMRYMALKAYIDGNWANSGPEDYKIVIRGLTDGSVMVRDLASTSLVESFVQNEEVGAVYTLFHELCKDGSVQFARALKTILSTSGKGMVLVAYIVIEMYWKMMGEITVQSIHVEVMAMMLERYVEKKPLDSLFLMRVGAWKWEDEGFRVLKGWVRHLSRECVSRVEWFSVEQWAGITEEYYYKVGNDCAKLLVDKCLGELKEGDVSVAKVRLLYNLRWFWIGDKEGVILVLGNVRNFTRDEGELADASDSDEFDISLSDGEGSMDLVGTSSQEQARNELECELEKFEAFLSALKVVEQRDRHAVVVQQSQSRLYHELLLDLSNEQLLEQWLKRYHEFDISLTVSLIYQIMESEFSLFQWQWVMTILGKLPYQTVMSIIPRSVVLLKPLKRFIQVIQVGNLKQRQDDSLTLRLQLWSLIESLFDTDLQSHSVSHLVSLKLLEILQSIIPYLQYGLKDSLKDPNFHPVLVSILKKVSSGCDPIIVLQPSLLQDLLSLQNENFPWIISTMDTIRYKML